MCLHGSVATGYHDGVSSHLFLGLEIDNYFRLEKECGDGVFALFFLDCVCVMFDAYPLEE